ncbi:MAG: DUF89 family protein [Candidatus Sabulitectum sp.]|nr:DUF89 family protein [Candidatus Sabulitectum sp.]
MGLNPGIECFNCFRHGFSDFVSRAGLSSAEYEKLIAIVEENLRQGATPPLAGSESWALLRKASVTGNDIFLLEKEHFTRQMLLHYERLKNSFLQLDNPQFMALTAGTWCNLIDVGQGVPLPETEELLNTFSSPLSVDETESFLNSLHETDVLLVLGDNAGETVMDKLFLDLTSFKGKKYYMTRTLPVMNDATLKDAEMAGLHKVAELISSGIDVPAIIPDMLSGRARNIYESAGIILAKGQGNLEGLFGLNDPRVYHSFVVKCPVVSRATGIALGGGVFSRFTNTGGKNANL